MDSSTKTYVAIGAVLVVVFAVIGWFGLRSIDEPAEQVVEETVPTPVPEPTPTLAERLSERLQGTTLKTSDVVVRQLVAELSSRPELVAWLANEDLIRRFVAAVDNTANGISPTTQLGFLRPKGSFEVIEKGDKVLVDPESYTRYDLLTQVFISLDNDGAATLYGELEPLMDDAFAEISPPGSSFSDRLDTAMDHLLEVTPPTGEPELNRKVVTYLWADESLETLSGAQRQLLRMGPDNVLLIKAKLRELKAGL